MRWPSISHICTLVVGAALLVPGAAKRPPKVRRRGHRRHGTVIDSADRFHNHDDSLRTSDASPHHDQQRRDLQEPEASGVGGAGAAHGGRPAMVDVWEADPELRLFKRLRDRAAGDHQPILDILGLGDDNHELEELWADPDMAHHILTSAWIAFVGVLHLRVLGPTDSNHDAHIFTCTRAQTSPCSARSGSATWRTRPGRTSPPRM